MQPQISVSLREFMEETDNMLLIEKQVNLSYPIFLPLFVCSFVSIHLY